MSNQLVLHKPSGKGIDKNISVETEFIMYDYQIEGVRFLFKQWKLWKDHSHNKPSSYCVLNFPPQSGKSVTVVLFLYAVRILISQPILVLCKDDKQVKDWTTHFEQWSGFTSDDIVVEPTKTLLNKQIFIKKMCDLGPFTRRSWSFLVVKDDECSSLPHFPQVEFTIWITSTDLAKDVCLLKSIHSWIMPKTEFKMETHYESNLKNNLLKHSMLEEFVLRKKTNSIKSTKKLLNDQCGNDTINSIKFKPRRSKNKDATGLKVKRSKGNTLDKDENDDTKMDVETFIRCQKPVQFYELDELDINDGNHDVDKTNVDSAKNDVGNEAASCDTFSENDKENCVTISGETVIKEELDFSIQNNIEKSVFDVVKSEDNKDINMKGNKTLEFENIPERNKTITGNVQNQGDVPIGKKLTNDLLSENSVSNEQTEYIVADIKKEEKSPIKRESDIDSKLNEMQEKAMKKFKGSFLDSIL